MDEPFPFEADVRAAVMEALPHDDRDTAELQALGTTELLIRLWNWRSRLVDERPRHVHRSRELLANPFRSEELNLAIDQIAQRLQAGTSVTPYLSRRVNTGFRSPNSTTGLGARADLDLMLSDWRIHHLHLSNERESDGFVARTRELLFAHFQPNHAYLIDIYHHGDWAAQQVVEVIARNWPKAGIIEKSRHVVGLAKTFSDAERSQLRQSGVTSFALEIDGSVWSPAGFMTMAGTSYWAWRYATAVRERLSQAEPIVRKGKDQELLLQWPSDGPRIPTNRDWHVGWTKDGWVLYESSTLVYYPLGI